MEYKYLLFDLDGTLTDSAEGIINSVVHALNELGEEVPEYSTLRKFIGPPLSYSFKEFCGMDEELTKKAIVSYRARYSTIGLFENAPYEGIPELLKEVKSAGFYLAIASSKPKPFVERILEKFEILQYFDCVAGAELNGSRGTKEDVIEDAFAYIGIDKNPKLKSQTIMIGDRHYDINGAKAFSIDSIGVKYGFADEGELEAAGATYVVETVEELKELLLGFKHE